MANLSLAGEDRRLLYEMFGTQRITFSRGEDLVNLDGDIDHALLVESGWACCYGMLPDGRRQIFHFLLASDLVGFMSLLLDIVNGNSAPELPLPPARQSALALTKIEALVIPRRNIATLFERHPRLCVALSCFVATRMTEYIAHHLMSTGRRTARERMAHLFVELWYRQRTNGLASDQEFSLPLGQHTLADALGVSAVHVSRVLGQLEDEGVIKSIHRSPRRIIVRNAEQLHEIAAIDRQDPVRFSYW